mgnify:CR=1 FL=1
MRYKYDKKKSDPLFSMKYKDISLSYLQQNITEMLEV